LEKPVVPVSNYLNKSEWVPVRSKMIRSPSIL
jgi:hypothetical protein